MTRTTTSPEVYTMGEARALHEPSGLWHYVRVYAPNPDAAKLALAEEALRRKWKFVETGRYPKSTTTICLTFGIDL